RSHNRVLAYRHSADDGRASCDPDIPLDHDGLSDRGGAAQRRFKGMARRDDAYVRPDQHVISDVETTEIIESAVLIDEDIAPDADFVPAGGIKWRDQHEALVYLLADELAEQRPNFGRIVERRTVECGGDRHCPFDVCHHGG